MAENEQISYELPKDLELSKKDEKSIQSYLKSFYRGIKTGLVIFLCMLLAFIIYGVLRWFGVTS